MIVLGLVGVIVFFWTVRSGQYEDLEGDANRILMDDDDPLLPDDKKQKDKKVDQRSWPDADDD